MTKILFSCRNRPVKNIFFKNQATFDSLITIKKNNLEILLEEAVILVILPLPLLDLKKAFDSEP